MNTVYTFKTKTLLFNHLRALCQLATSIRNCKLPLFDFDVLSPHIGSLLPYLRKSLCGAIYFTIREHGFEFDCDPVFFESTTRTYHDIIQSYVLTYNGRYYELRAYPVK